MSDQVYADRAEAGRLLGVAVRDRLQAPASPLVLGLPRGGVPVAAEVTRALGAPLDVLVVRKVGVPEQPELAMGAVGPGGVCVRNEALLARLPGAAQEFARVALRGRSTQLGSWSRRRSRPAKPWRCSKPRPTS